MQSVQKSANFSAFGHLAGPELQPGGDFLSGLLFQFPLTRCRFCITACPDLFFLQFFNWLLCILYALCIFSFYTSNCHGPWQRQESWRWRNPKWRKSFSWQPSPGLSSTGCRTPVHLTSNQVSIVSIINIITSNQVIVIIIIFKQVIIIIVMIMKNLPLSFTLL